MAIERDSFGLPVVPVDENPDLDFLQSVAPEAQEQVVTEPPAEPAAPVAGPLEPAAEVVPAPDAGTLAGEQKLYAGKYETVEQVEKGYREARDMSRRSAERAKAAEQELEEIKAKASQLEDTLRKAAPILQRVLTQPQTPAQPLYDQFGNPVPVPQPQPITSTPTQYDIEQIVAQRLAAAQGQMQQQFTEQQLNTMREQNILSFYEKHPEVVREGPLDSDITETVRALGEAWGDSQLDISNPDVLEIAYEATQNPQLRSVLSLNPAYIDTDEGLALARIQAAMLRGDGTITQQTSQVPASVVGQRKPNLESASQGAAPAAEAPMDEVDSAIFEYRKANARSGDSIFFPGR